MDTANEASSSLTLASSSLSNGCCNHNNPSALTSNGGAVSLENLSLNKLSGCLEKLLVDDEYDYSDAQIVAEGIAVGVHRCILASRSLFFHDLFKKGNNSSTQEGKPRYLLSELVPHGKVGYEAFKVFLHYLYTGKLKPSPPEVSTCVDETCVHDACGPAINYAVELMYVSATFQMKELVLLVQRRLLNFVDKAHVEDVIPILMAAFQCQLSQVLSYCIQRMARSNLDYVNLEKDLPSQVLSDVKSLRVQSQLEAASSGNEVEAVRGKNIRRILKALDSDDVELVKLLLNESDVTLNDAYALHYSCAYCDPKVVKEVLSLGSGDPNLKNPRGYTVLHVAARRKEPSVLVALLSKGASAFETTLDGQNAVSLCRQLTRPKDYNEKPIQGKESNKDRLCIDVLEREMKRSSISGNMSDSSPLVVDDLQVKLDYLENRVAFARVIYPTEARVAMEIADANSSSFYARLSSKGSNGNLREVDLNEEPSRRAERLQSRLRALTKTVETGRRYFPNCSEVLDKFVEVDMPDIFFLEKGTAEEQRLKKMRFTELKEEVQKAFHKDIAENNRSGLSASSSCSSSTKEVLGRKGGKGQVMSYHKISNKSRNTFC